MTQLTDHRFGGKRLFISYCSQDSADVIRLATDLRGHGVAIWLDQWEVEVGDSVAESISTALRGASHVAIWLTSNSVASRWVRREWQSVLSLPEGQKGPKVIPLLAEDCDVPLLLRDVKYADFTVSYREGLGQVLAALEGAEKVASSSAPDDAARRDAPAGRRGSWGGASSPARRGSRESR